MAISYEAVPQLRDYLEFFAQEEKIFAQIEIYQEDDTWTAVEGIGFQGIVSKAYYYDETLGGWGVQVLPDEPQPRGEHHANRAPWLITSQPFWAERENGNKEQFRMILHRIS